MRASVMCVCVRACVCVWARLYFQKVLQHGTAFVYFLPAVQLLVCVLVIVSKNERKIVDPERKFGTSQDLFSFPREEQERMRDPFAVCGCLCAGKHCNGEADNPRWHKHREVSESPP